jgi:ATP-dependent protease ClpP protease subunit
MKAERKLGIFRVNGVICQDVALELEQAIGKYVRKEDGMAAAITLIINSEGGEYYSTLGLFDTLGALSAQGHHITTVIRGQCASAAVLLFQAGDTRIMGPESWMMVHEIREQMEHSTAAQIADEAAVLDRQCVRMFDILTDRAAIDSDELMALSHRKDLWLDADEAYEYGLTDEIG